MSSTGEPEYTRNQLMRIRLRAPLVIDLLWEQTSYSVGHPRLLTALARLGEPMTASAVIATLAGPGENVHDATQLFDELTARKIIVRAGEQADIVAAAGHWERRGWGDALQLHLKSRALRYTDTVDCAGGERSQPPMTNAGRSRTRVSRSDIWHRRSGIGDDVRLSAPTVTPISEPIEDILLRRRSGQKWTGRQALASDVSQMLAYGNEEGVLLRRQLARDLDTKPDAPLLTSPFSCLETYLIAFDVEGLPSGLYHYRMEDHALTPIAHGVFQQEFIRMCIGQKWAGGSSFALLVTALWRKYMQRYRHPRAYRNLLINAGELMHKYLILATALRRSTFITPAFDDQFAASLLDVDQFTESPIYTVAVG